MKMRNFAFASAAILAASAATAGPNDDYGYGHMWGGGFGMMGGGLMMLLFWSLIIALIFFAVRWFYNKERGSGSDALAILEERFARGEIDEDEFNHRKSFLNS
ncbi:MAG: SHOCT domain-containing protein [Paracoccaceae bacterium]|nr:SHOCT domain-containing protein [Paracoccaceae bacterium]MDG2259467.1 SHOCT domain-containing protein [Paracoccaceae bacterium]